MSSDPEYSRKVREERRRRRRELARQQEQSNDGKVKEYDPSTQFSKEQIDQANAIAKQHRNQLHDQCDDTLDRILQTASDTHKTGTDTLGNIHDQQQQLRKIHKDLHEIDQDQKDTQRSLQTIRSWGGQIKNWFSGERQQETYAGMEADKKRKTNKDYKQEKNEKYLKQTQRSYDSRQEEKHIDKLRHKNKDDLTHGERKEIRNHKLNQLNVLADDLNEMAITMGQELKHTNKQINEVSDKFYDVNQGINDKNEQMKRIRH